MGNKLELLSGPAVTAAIEQANATVYRYQVNNAGLVVALVIAVVFYAFAGLVFWQTDISEPIWFAAFIGVMFVGMGFTATAAFWHQFATQQLVAVSDERFFVGGPKATWAIAWEFLDAQAMGFETMEMTRLRGALRMHVAGQDIRLHLYNPIAYLADVQGFMHGVLSHLNADDSDTAAVDSDDNSEEESW